MLLWETARRLYFRLDRGLRIVMSHGELQRRQILRTGACCAAGALFAPRRLWSAVEKKEFAVASIRENTSNDKPSSNIPLDRSDASFSGDTLRATNQPLIAFIIFAYKMKVSESFGGLMAKLPDWAVKSRFDIVAKTDGAAAGKAEMREMTRALLEDRFQLKTHREEMDADVLGMYLKGNSDARAQLKQSSSDACTSLLPVSLNPAKAGVAELVGNWPMYCGDAQEVRVSRYLVRSAGRWMEMAAITDWLTGVMDNGKVIQDRTNLPGRYDFALEYTPEYFADRPQDPQHLENVGPSPLEAIEQQLGMQLKKERGRITVFRVDHVAYPSGN